MAISSKNIIWITLNIFYAIVLYFITPLFSNIQKERQIVIVCWIGIFTTILTFIMIKNARKGFDFYSILISLTFIFMFGQHLIYMLGIYPKDMIILTNRVSAKALYNTGILVCYCIISLNIGYLLYSGKIATDINSKTNINENENARIYMYKSGLFFFYLSLIPTTIELVTNIYLTFTVGYGERLLNSAYKRSGITNITGIVSGFMVPSLLALFISRKPKQKWPIIALIIYMVLYMLSGSRINTMILLIGTLYIQNRYFSRLNFKKIVIYIISIVLIMFLFSVISTARKNVGYGNDYFSTIQSSIENIAENNPVISALSEAGYTFEATSTVIDNCPSNEPYNYGVSYLSGIVYILPNGLTGNYYNTIARSTDDTFKGYINAYGSGIGSSFIAEAYWNFGYFSLLLMVVLGFLLGKLCTKLNYAIESNDFVRIYIVTYSLIIISFYVRSDTRTFYRNFVWFGLPLLLLYKYKEQKLNAKT